MHIGLKPLKRLESLQEQELPQHIQSHKGGRNCEKYLLVRFAVFSYSSFPCKWNDFTFCRLTDKTSILLLQDLDQNYIQNNLYRADLLVNRPNVSPEWHVGHFMLRIQSQMNFASTKVGGYCDTLVDR